jgi:hypothetical protein
MIDEPMIGRVARELGLDGTAKPEAPPAARPAPPARQGKIDLGEIDRYLAGLSKPG